MKLKSARVVNYLKVDKSNPNNEMIFKQRRVIQIEWIVSIEKKITHFVFKTKNPVDW
jgi:hypothetical protein